jgi:hypothetical protein
VLGTYRFDRGDSGAIVLQGMNNGDLDTSYVRADAARFVHLQEED